jgi:hypothetical protein
MLAALLNRPRNKEEWDRYSFDHRDSHQKIRQAIQAQKGIVLIDYQLDPVFGVDIQGWLQRNSQSHSDFDGVLGLQSTDLLDVDFNDESQFESWTYLHYQEHLNAEQALGI